MELKILHLYPDCMSLYGEYANVAVLRRHLENLGVSAAVSYWLITGMAMAAMAAAMLFTVVMLTLVQAQVPGQLLGKVIACIQAVANCASPLGQAGYGIL